MGRKYAAVPYESWPKPSSPPDQSVLQRFKIRTEVLHPELFPNKRRRGPINPNTRVLYDISEPMSDLDGEEEGVRLPSRSSTGTLHGDNTNNGSESPIRGEDRSLDGQNDESTTPSRNNVQPYARELASTPPNDDWNGWDRNRDDDSMNNGSESPIRGEDRSLDEQHDESPTPSRNSVQPYVQESASTLLNDDWSVCDRSRDHDAVNEDVAKPRVARSLDHDSELNELRDSRQSSLESRVPGLTDDLSKLPRNGHGGRSCMSNGMKRKRPCNNLPDSEDLPSSPPLLPNYTVNNAQEGLELSDDPIEASDLSDWDQQYRHPVRSDERRGYESGSDYWRSSSQRSSTQLGQSGSQGQQFMMSGALADGSPDTSTIPLPDDMCVHDAVKSGPNCLCQDVPAGTEKYQGHCHFIRGITVIRGMHYFQCGVLCSDDIVSVPFDYFKTSCPNITRNFLSPLTS